jgi:hypothetical protein
MDEQAFLREHFSNFRFFLWFIQITTLFGIIAVCGLLSLIYSELVRHRKD